MRSFTYGLQKYRLQAVRQREKKTANRNRQEVEEAECRYKLLNGLGLVVEVRGQGDALN